MMERFDPFLGQGKADLAVPNFSDNGSQTPRTQTLCL
jgi:hypothetical protein